MTVSTISRFSIPREVSSMLMNKVCSSVTQKVMLHIYFLGPILLKKNVLHSAAFKCPTFMHVVARSPARWIA